ncbi:hypothetical protein Zmor_021982 [Zophobas morio]|uniref:PNPLA domain-containing protein n=2 Tax=Zophobas morio TaxID=2755281 RepID=A0AA38MAX7_9CUCU|nr:hypothetical protein Zmor_021982 [Zophobas morio]
MSLNQQKIVHHLKDSVSKITNNKIVQDFFEKQSLQIVQRLPVRFISDFLKYVEQCIDRSKNNDVLLLENLKHFNTKFNIKRSIVVAPKWNRKSTIISKCSISSQTLHTILSIETAENEDALLKRIEALIVHLQQYPESRNCAIRAGAIPMLLRINKKITSDNVKGAIRVALASLGYANPVARNGIRILSMDGGGIRGLLILEMLKKLEELTQKRVHELFDLFCGVSTGAILAFSLGIHHASLDEIAKHYKDISFAVFKQSRLWGTGNLVWNQAFYDTSLWEKKLREHLGTSTLIDTNRNSHCPKLCAISAVVNQSHLSAFVFRNYSPPWKVKPQYFGSSEHEVWQAARASAAAPTIFEEYKLGNFLHQDGGILVNNPTAVALHEAKLIWPNTPIQCVVSFGTGRTVPTPTDNAKRTPDDSSNTSWAHKFYKILDSATDTEGVHVMLSDLLPHNVYYRFNPYLTEMISMTEINPQKLEQLQRDTIMYLRRNEDKFQEAAKVLIEKKTCVQKCKDFINFNREIYNI